MIDICICRDERANIKSEKSRRAILNKTLLKRQSFSIGRRKQTFVTGFLSNDPLVLFSLTGAADLGLISASTNHAIATYLIISDYE